MSEVLLLEGCEPSLPFAFLERLESLFGDLLDTNRQDPVKEVSLTSVAIDLLKTLMKRSVFSLNLFRMVSGRWVVCHTANVSFIVGSLFVNGSFPYAFAVQGMKAVILHDIGHFFLKSASVEDDFDEKKDNHRLHPVLGYKFCVQLNLSADECDAVLYHHERFDGTGFISRKGKTIPFYARIIRLADEVERLLMRCERTPADFLGSLLKLRGTVLDPDLVGDFLGTFGPLPTGARVSWKGETLVCRGLDKKSGKILFDTESGDLVFVPIEHFAKKK